MAYPRNAPRKQQNETIIAAVVCLALGYALCWIIQVPAQPRVCSCQLCPLILNVALNASCIPALSMGHCQTAEGCTWGSACCRCQL